MARRLAVPVAVGALAIVAGWVLFVGLPRWYAPKGPPAAAVETSSTTPERKITATLYYVSEDGAELIGMQREVPFAEEVLEQARRIIEAQLATPPAPLVSAIPDGTSLRNLYLTDKGEAFVDVSPDVRMEHPGGALDELFTVYTIVNALTVNLPAIQRVQILIDGKEVDTLAGHVDLRQPLQKGLKWVQANSVPQQ
jgi:spore germination protein GerM